MKKLVVLCGISGSGKSHFAHQEWLKDPLNVAVVNRDKIRELLFGYTEETIKDYYRLPEIGKLEKQVTLYEDTLIHEGLNLGKTVIVDATHLKKSYLERYKFWNVPVEFKYFEVSLITAALRVADRTRDVGAEVIAKQYDNFLNLQREGIPFSFEPVEFKQDETLPPCVIYDIDGTIAEKGNRSAFDWKRVGEDKTVYSVIATIDWIAELHPQNRPKVIICTGRDGICLEETKEWLFTNRIVYDVIFMRDIADQRADWIVKEEMWREIAKENYIVGMYDDRNQVVRRARALGLKVFQVEYGNF